MLWRPAYANKIKKESLRITRFARENFVFMHATATANGNKVYSYCAKSSSPAMSAVSANQ